MRLALGLVLVAIEVATTLSPAVARAGLPDPARSASGVPCTPLDRSVWLLDSGPLPCQYRFRADGGLDELRVILTLRDCFDTPVPGCTIKATVAPAPGNPAFCACEPADQFEVTDAQGAAAFTFRGIGGRGSGVANLTLLCSGAVGFPGLPFDFTSPDQNGSCEPGGSTTVIDLGIWAAGLSAYRRESDLDCNGTVNVVDLGLWAGGLGLGCP